MKPRAKVMPKVERKSKPKKAKSGASTGATGTGGVRGERPGVELKSAGALKKLTRTRVTDPTGATASGDYLYHYSEPAPPKPPKAPKAPKAKEEQPA